MVMCLTLSALTWEDDLQIQPGQGGAAGGVAEEADDDGEHPSSNDCCLPAIGLRLVGLVEASTARQGCLMLCQCPM